MRRKLLSHQKDQKQGHGDCQTNKSSSPANCVFSKGLCVFVGEWFYTPVYQQPRRNSYNPHWSLNVIHKHYEHSAGSQCGDGYCRDLYSNKQNRQTCADLPNNNRTCKEWSQCHFPFTTRTEQSMLWRPSIANVPDAIYGRLSYYVDSWPRWRIEGVLQELC